MPHRPHRHRVGFAIVVIMIGLIGPVTMWASIMTLVNESHSSYLTVVPLLLLVGFASFLCYLLYIGIIMLSDELKIRD